MGSTQRQKPAWHKSSYSTANGSCVEVAEGSSVLVRDTENRNLGHLTAPSAEWSAFIAALGKSPLDLYRLIYTGAFGTWFSWQNTLLRAAPAIGPAASAAPAVPRLAGILTDSGVRKSGGRGRNVQRRQGQGADGSRVSISP